MGTKITFRRPDGKQAAGYLAKAGRAKAPGVVVIQRRPAGSDRASATALRWRGMRRSPRPLAGTVVPYHDTDAADAR